MQPLPKKPPSHSEFLQSFRRWFCGFSAVMTSTGLLGGTDGADGLALVAVIKVNKVIACRKAEVIRTIGNADIKRTRPINAIGTHTHKIFVPAITSSRKEKTASITCSKKESVHPVLNRPSASRVVAQFLPLFHCRYVPTCSPLHQGRIINPYRFYSTVTKLASMPFAVSILTR